MPKRLTIEEVKERCFKKGLFLKEGNYKNRESFLTFEDKEGYKYYLSWGEIRSNKNNNFNKVLTYNKYSIRNIQHFLDLKGYGTKIISTKFTGQRDSLKFICGVCGNEFESTWENLKKGNRGTCVCCGLKRSSNSHLKNKDLIKEEIKKKGYILLKDYDNLHYIEVEDKNGYRYNTSYYNLNDKEDVCHKFNKRNIYTLYNLKHFFKTEMTDIIFSENNSFIPYEEEVSTHKFNFICAKCGEEYSSTLNNIFRIHTMLCERCNKIQSNISFMVENYLKLKGVKYEKEKRFDDCKNKRTLPFDYYLPKYNTVLEVNGCQHYYENALFKQSLEERQKVDLIKKNYCKDKGISFVEIPFWLIYNSSEEKEAYKNIIDKILE